MFGGDVFAAKDDPDKAYACTAGYVYDHSSDYRYRKTDFQHEHTNNKSVTDSVSYTVQTTESAQASTSVSASLNGMVASAGVSTQVGWGVTESKSISVTWNIPAYSSYLLEAGSKYVKAQGSQKYLNTDCSYSNYKSVDGDWTYRTWSDSSPL